MQLTVLGYILVPIFTYNMWWLVLLYSFFMLYVGCLEAVQCPAYTYQVSRGFWMLLMWGYLLLGLIC